MSVIINFTTISVLPKLFEGFSQEGVFAQAIKNHVLGVKHVNLRDFATDVRRQVDDAPYGGGDGMVFRPDVLGACLDAVVTKESTVICLSPAGKVWNADAAKLLAQKKDLVFICGRYAGLDQRITQTYVDFEISIGDFVLSGGELAAMVLMDSIARFVPGILGNTKSAQLDSFEGGLLEAPLYTKPAVWNSKEVPDVLSSGNHKAIEKFNRLEQIKRTAQNRPDLIMLLWDTLSAKEKVVANRCMKSIDLSIKN